MKHLDRGMSWVLALVMLISMMVLPAVGCAETNSDSNTVYFDPRMIQLLDISASDFTKTKDLRALFAFILSYEFNQQETGHEYDFTKTIYVAISNLGIATAAIGLEDGYVCLFYSNLTDPATTAYTILETTSSFVVKLVLEGNNSSVWDVPLADFSEQGQALADALKG